jgi:thiamine biosynthesis lipoprotein
MKFILDRCEELTEITDGYFDMRATADRSLDPSGLVKGWSVDRAAELLLDAGLTNFAVSAGGDMRLAGCADPESEWRVGIQHPSERDKIALVVAGNDLAIATSGAYIRGDHVADPHTGEAPRAVLSVTITGPVLADADAFATAAFAMDERGPEWTSRLVGYEAMTIMADGRVLSTAAFPVAPPE